MTQEIRSSLADVLGVRSVIEEDLDSLCAFRLSPLYGVLPVAGSADRDGRLSALLSASLDSLRAVVAADERSLSQAHDALARADANAAAAFGKG